MFLNVPLSAKEQQKETCPPPCKNISTYIFGDKFCCTKKDDIEVHCSYKLLDDEKNQCIEWQEVSVSYFPEEKYVSSDPKKEVQKDLKNPPFSYGYAKKLLPMRQHQCLDKDISIAYNYNPFNALISATIYHPNSSSWMIVDSYLEADLPEDSKLVKEATNNFLDYLCNHFNPKQFWETQKASPFSFPHNRDEDKHPVKNAPTNTSLNTKEARKEAVVTTTTKANTTTTQANTTTTQANTTTTQANTTDTAISPKKVPQSSENTVKRQVALSDTDSWHVLGAYFYKQAVPGNLSTVRQFATADQQQILKINFTSGKKESFLEKLKNQFSNDIYKVHTCKNQKILFEVQTDIYQVFILSPNAISVLAKPTGYPATSLQRKELCNFNAALAY